MVLKELKYVIALQGASTQYNLQYIIKSGRNVHVLEN